MNDFRKIIYGVLIAFVAMLVIWLSFLTSLGCGFSLACLGAAPQVERTSIPTLIPATFPAPVQYLATFTPTPGADASTPGAVAGGPTEVAVARPSNPGGPGPAVDLTGDVDSGKQIFVANCQLCHAAEGKGGNPNPGSTDGTIPPLNPIDPSLVGSDNQTYVTNLDLFLEHGSTPAGTSPTFSMPPWGDTGALTPQQIADVIAYIISLNK
jgi:mono/diheme cytochrome c family protein